MAAAAPAQLSGLVNLLLRRPPSLRELVTLVGYADDYAWFVGLVRRLFPQEAEAALAAPDVRGRVERFANLFGERHFPLYAPFSSAHGRADSSWKRTRHRGKSSGKSYVLLV